MRKKVIEIPKLFFTQTIKELGKIKNYKPFVGIAGDWNNWLESNQKPGYVKIKKFFEHEAEETDNNFIYIKELQPGIYTFKPVIIINTKLVEDDFVKVRWISCPQYGWGKYTSSGKNNNWTIS